MSKAATDGRFFMDWSVVSSQWFFLESYIVMELLRSDRWPFTDN